MTRKPADPAARRRKARRNMIEQLTHGWDARELAHCEAEAFSHEYADVLREARALLRSLRRWAKEEGSK